MNTAVEGLPDYMIDQSKAINGTGQTRRAILEGAISCVCGAAHQQQGSPQDTFTTIAEFWTAYIKRSHQNSLVSFTAHDVGAMMCLANIGQIASGSALCDSYVDLAGHAACAGEIAREGK